MQSLCEETILSLIRRYDVQDTMARFVSLLGALLAYVFYSFGPGLHRTSTVLGVFRTANTSVIQEVVVIPDTINCEDIHYHAPSGTLFTVCEDNIETRFRWFPPLDNFDDPELARKARGSIHVVDPKAGLTTITALIRL